MKINKFLGLFFLSITVFTSGCGFDLRGQAPLPPALKRMYLESNNPYGQLVHYIKQYLKFEGTTWVATPKEAFTVLTILHEETGQTLLSVGGTQQTRQYNVGLNVTFQLTRPNGTVIIPPQTLSQTRTLTVQSNQILGDSNQATALYQQMRDTIVDEIIDRLRATQFSTSLGRPST